MISVSEGRGEQHESNVFYKKLKCGFVHLFFCYIISYIFFITCFLYLKQK